MNIEVTEQELVTIIKALESAKREAFRDGDVEFSTEVIELRNRLSDIK